MRKLLLSKTGGISSHPPRLCNAPNIISANDREAPNDQVHRAGASPLDEAESPVAPAPVQPLVRRHCGLLHKG